MLRSNVLHITCLECKRIFSLNGNININLSGESAGDGGPFEHVREEDGGAEEEVLVEEQEVHDSRCCYGGYTGGYHHHCCRYKICLNKYALVDIQTLILF